MRKTTAQKLYIKPDTVVRAAAAERVFADDEATLRRQFERHGPEPASRLHLWVAYPNGNRADINREALLPIPMELDLRGIGQIAVDDIGSAMRFQPLRSGEVPGGQKREESR